MRWLGLLSALLVISSGCNSTPDVPSKIDIAKPAGDIEQKSQRIQDNASQLSGKLDNLSHEVNAPDVDTDAPEAEATAPDVELKPHVREIERDAEDIESTAGVLADTQPNIDKLNKEVKEQRRKEQREVKHLWTWIQVAGVLMAGLGIAAGIYLGRLRIAIGVGAAGFGIAGAARVWQQYAQYFVLAIVLTMGAAFVYLVYYGATHRKALAKKIFSQVQTKKDQKVEAEIERKGK